MMLVASNRPPLLQGRSSQRRPAAAQATPCRPLAAGALHSSSRSSSCHGLRLEIAGSSRSLTRARVAQAPPPPPPPAAAPAPAPAPGPNGASEAYTPRTEPSEATLSIWRKADAVCFDVDCTICQQDSLDLLADFMGVKDEVEKLTNQAMDGSLTLQVALEQRLDIINCTPADIKRFIAAFPPATRLVPGIAELIRVLQARGVAVYLISGGFRELTLPIAAYLNVPKENVFANRMNWQWDDDTGEPTRLVGFDISEPTAHNRGKPAAIARIRQNNPYNNIVMIGDGITDLEAVQISGGADLFIGYGGVVERPAVASQADWYVYDYGVLLKALRRFSVAFVGSGAWACAAVRMVAQNTMLDDPADEFVDDVKMWVYQEDYQGQKLTDVINATHENPSYLPGISLGTNVVAEPDLFETVRDADCIVMCAPHQFVHGICKQLAGKTKPGAMVISLIKGMRVRPEGPQLISAMVQRYLGADCCVLMGANIAIDTAKEQLSEAVIGYSNLSNAKVWKKLFQRPYFSVDLLPDVVGAEMCGTLKNVVAVAAGMVDGLGLGANSKAAIIRQGLQEMRTFSKALYPTVRDETFFHSCGIGDLIATCYGGRNRLVAEEWTKAYMAGKPTTFEQLEKDVLKGQKLQGTLTSNEVQEILRARKWEAQYPLFTTVNRIISGHLSPEWVLRYNEGCHVDISSLHTMDADELEIPRRRKSSSTSALAPPKVAA